MKKILRTLCIEKILTGLSEKIKISLVFTDLDGKRIMSTVALDDPVEPARDEMTSCRKVPVIANGQLIGNISSSTTTENLESLLYSAAYCIENSFRLEDEIEDLSAEIVNVYQELSLIYSLSNKLGGDLDISSICQQVVEEISSALDVKTILLLLHDVNNGMLSVKACTGLEWEKVSSFSVNPAAEPFAKLFSGKKASVITDQSITSSLPASLQATLCVPLRTDNRPIGLLIAQDKASGEEFLSPEIKLLDALSGEIAGAIKKAQLYEKINRLFISTVEALASAIDAKDPYTYGHSRRVALMTTTICKEIGMSSDEIHMIKLAALLHDIGKIGTPEYILQKPGRLNSAEVKIVQEHPNQGAQILLPFDELKDFVCWIKHHHERYDGEGYPDKKIAEDIPLPSRIIAIADCFDAMTSDRPYRKAMNTSLALDIMNDLAGSQFDPGLFEVFKSTFIQNHNE
jgi:putative nucleotidyltransferase with HDIG domain